MGDPKTRELPGWSQTGRPDIPSGSSGVPLVQVQRHGARQGRQSTPRPGRHAHEAVGDCWPAGSSRKCLGWRTALSFGNGDTIRHFDHFYFCFYTSILAVLSWELGEKHIFLYRF